MRFSLFATLLFAAPALADPAIVEDVDARPSGASWTVSVTISHADTGWDNYADGWRVELRDGTVLGTRVLHHPHVQEQPFTRSLGGVDVPDGTTRLGIRTRTNTDGWSDTVWMLDIPTGQ